MPKNLDAKLAQLPVRRRARVQARSAELSTLRDLRLAAQQTQQEVAQALGVRQDTVSRLEQRSDILLSTMRRYVQAMGGSLDIIVKFPNRPQIKLDSFAKAHAIEPCVLSGILVSAFWGQAQSESMDEKSQH